MRDLPASGPGRVALAALCACVAALVAGCSRPEGDFGRARPSFVHDTMMPAAGKVLAANRGEAVSTFNMTDDEQLLRDRAWNFIRPPHTADWLNGTAAELQRTRISADIDTKLDPADYYKLLSSERYRSSDARYDRVVADADADTALIPPFCKVAVRVEDLDRERMGTIGRRPNLTREEYAGAVARVEENRQLIAWAKRAMRFRLGAYKIAIDRLEIETPSRTRLWDANTAWRRLAGMVRYVDTGCRDLDPLAQEKTVRRSRIFTGWGDERPTPVK